MNIQYAARQSCRTHATSRTAAPRRSIVAIIPALNEAPAIRHVVEQTLKQLAPDGQRIFEQVIVVDNGSTDGTGKIAATAGAKVVHEPRRGYGAACLRGLREIGHSDIIVFIDGDASTCIAEVERLLSAIDAGAELAIGKRANGQRDSMTVPQRFGNNLACALIRLLWRVRVTDLGPFRAITREALQRIDMRDQAYGWTVEMQVRAFQLGMRVHEVSVTVCPRIGRSKISGTLRGVIGAAHGIFTTISRLWWSGSLSRNRTQNGQRNQYDH